MINYCENRCCAFIITNNPTNEKKIHFQTNKAGIVPLLPNKKILIIQSYNDKWGIPKGTVLPNENISDCAIRELEEETKIKLKKKNLLYSKLKIYKIKKTLYYIYFQKFLEYQLNDFINNSESEITGMGIVNPFCICNNIKYNHLTCLIIQTLSKENEFC